MQLSYIIPINKQNDNSQERYSIGQNKTQTFQMTFAVKLEGATQNVWLKVVKLLTYLLSTLFSQPCLFNNL